MSPEGRTLLLITASSPDIQRVRRSRVLNFQQITMPYLAAFVPSHWIVLHVDEAAEPVDFEIHADLVRSPFTPRARRTPTILRLVSGNAESRWRWAGRTSPCCPMKRSRTRT